MYSQNNEENHILEFFKDFTGRLLDIGANDGKTFSNSLALIEKGWEAILVEPSTKAYDKLRELHDNRKNVLLLFHAIGTENKTTTLHESGHHLKDKSDVALLSSLKMNETDRWRKQNVSFEEIPCDVVTYKRHCEICNCFDYDFISIDAEGMDLDILKQIDLSKTKLLCIEWNSDPQVRYEILEYTNKFGLNKVIYQTGENLIISR